MNQTIRNLAYLLTSKFVDESKLDVLELKLKKSDIHYFNLSSNSILSFEYNGELCYFRECPRLQSKTEYFKASVDKFFVSVYQLGISKEHFSQEIPINIEFTDEVISAFRMYINKKLHSDSFFKSMCSADIISENTDFSIWKNQTYDSNFFSAFSLHDLDQKLYDIAVYFLWYMRSAAYTFRTLRIAKGKNYSFFSAVRSVSTVVVAEALGFEHMVTNAQWCKVLIEDGECMFGVLSNSAPGNRMCDSDVSPCPSLQRELMNLNILDLICYQTDHGPNNYNICKTADGSYTVCAFDNDNPYTFFPVSKLYGSFAGCSAFVSKNGKILRPCLDSDTARRVINMDIGKLKSDLKPYMNFLQINATVSRIKKLIKAIELTSAADKDFLLVSDLFNDKTVEEELSGNYGTTYLTKIIK